MGALTERRGAVGVILRDLGCAAMVGVLFVAPFAVLEASSTTITRANLPGLIVLFGLLWLLPAASTAVLAMILRSRRTGAAARTRRGGVWLGTVFVAAMTVMWFGIVLDQMPCFLGLANCD